MKDFVSRFAPCRQVLTVPQVTVPCLCVVLLRRTKSRFRVEVYRSSLRFMCRVEVREFHCVPPSSPTNLVHYILHTSQLRRELVVPALNTSDVTRGLARLSNSGYLGSGPAHAWSSSGAVSTSSASTTAVAAAKRAVDLSLRKRAVDFDQLVPLLLDTVR